MGMKHSKIKGEYYLPSTPTSVKSLSAIKINTDDYYDDIEEDVNNLDPRSPHFCRTPLNEVELHSDEEVFSTPNQTPKFDNLKNKKKFCKEKIINELFDPRSPSSIINRTPIIFDNTENNENLIDTFSDLFINTDVTPNDNEISKESIEPEENLKTDAVNELTNTFTEIETATSSSPEMESQIDSSDLLEESKNDPRSPTIGVDRTPIILNKIKQESSFVFKELPETLKLSNHLPLKLKHKALERVKNPPRIKIRSSARIAAANRVKIYKDRGVQVFSTPKKSNENTFNINASNITPIEKRTPLGCMANRPHLRSKSLENTKKKINQITSFDDYNPKRFGKEVNDENNSSMNNFLKRIN